MAATWHFVAVGFVTALGWRHADGRVLAGLLALMAFSVATMSWWGGNPFNTTVFVVVGIATSVLAVTMVEATVNRPSGSDVVAGAIMCGFGWAYPHFLHGPAWQSVYAAPLGLIPCPTLSFIIGASLLTASFGSAIWGILVALLGLFYGFIGVFVLNVTIDWMLIGGAAVLLARTAAPMRVFEALTINREKRHV